MRIIMIKILNQNSSLGRENPLLAISKGNLLTRRQLLMTGEYAILIGWNYDCQPIGNPPIQ